LPDSEDEENINVKVEILAIPVCKESILRYFATNLIVIEERRTQSWQFRNTTLMRPSTKSLASETQAILVCVTSAPANFEQRKVIRETWGTTPEFKVLFFIGQSEPNDAAMIRKEVADYNDILMHDFTEDAGSQTLKTAALLLWAKRNPWKKRKFLIKCNDDTFINSRLLIKNVHSLDNTKAIYGEIRANGKPIRDPIYKDWAVRAKDYPFEQYPSYADGCFYMISEKALSDLAESLCVPRYLFKEDVYLTGIVAEVAGIPRQSMPQQMEIDPFPGHRNINDLRRLVAKRCICPISMRKAWWFLMDHMTMSL